MKMKKIIAIIAFFAFMVGPLRAVSHQVEARNRVITTNAKKRNADQENAKPENAKIVRVRRLDAKTANKSMDKRKVIPVIITIAGGLALGGDYIYYLYTTRKSKGNSGFFKFTLFGKVFSFVYR